MLQGKIPSQSDFKWFSLVTVKVLNSYEMKISAKKAGKMVWQEVYKSGRNKNRMKKEQEAFLWVK